MRKEYYRMHRSAYRSHVCYITFRQCLYSFLVVFESIVLHFHSVDWFLCDTSFC